MLDIPAGAPLTFALLTAAIAALWLPWRPGWRKEQVPSGSRWLELLAAPASPPWRSGSESRVRSRDWPYGWAYQRSGRLEASIATGIRPQRPALRCPKRPFDATWKHW